MEQTFVAKLEPADSASGFLKPSITLLFSPEGWKP